MMYVRPKKPEDVQIGDPKYFSHFIFHLLRNKVLNTKQINIEITFLLQNDFLWSIFERWGKGWGVIILDTFKDDFSFTTQVRDLDVNQILELYQFIINLPQFHSSVFASEAETAHSEGEKNFSDVDQEEMEHYRTTFDRKQADLRYNTKTQSST